MVPVVLLVGLAVGVVVGALGAGGGILMFPVLVFLLGQDPHSAAASSAVIVGLSALVGIVHHARRGGVAWRDGAVFGAVAIAATVLGSRAAGLFPSQVLLGLFAALLGVIAVVMSRRASEERRHEAVEARILHQELEARALFVHDDPVLDAPGADQVHRADGIVLHHGQPELPATSGSSAVSGAAGRDDSAQRDSAGRDDSAQRDPAGRDGSAADAPDDPAGRDGSARRVVRLFVTASLTGAVTGLFGVGGGFIVLPMLVLAMGLPMRRASGTSLLVMIISTSVSLLARIGTPVEVDWPLTLLLAAGSMAGGALGGPLASRARPSTLTLLFALLLAAVSLVTLGQILLG